MFESLLVPWLESLPHLLVDLGHANPSLSAFIIDSMTSAAVQACVPLKQLENHIASVLGAIHVVCVYVYIYTPCIYLLYLYMHVCG